MIKQGISFEEVYDKFAVRIIYKSKLEKRNSSHGKYIQLIQITLHQILPDLEIGFLHQNQMVMTSLHITVVGLKKRGFQRFR